MDLTNKLVGTKTVFVIAAQRGQLAPFTERDIKKLPDNRCFHLDELRVATIPSALRTARREISIGLVATVAGFLLSKQHINPQDTYALVSGVAASLAVFSAGAAIAYHGAKNLYAALDPMTYFTDITVVPQAPHTP